ncbi:(E,E)-geranyllinalool synthase [Senna tora]|uniref:(E,E)-geranyllinalool synthase n=1 Tax=Senna tora TaxID=362788 RepID=A0A835CKM1_9FABA|nr:(E,E)-geranyllinalool synthase [Senna tora]
MEPSLLAQKIKGEMTFSLSSRVDPYSFVCASAYDTAWLAMIPQYSSDQPMFTNCLNWVLNNQKEDGFWGDCDSFGNPTIQALPSTLASIVALKKWNTGSLLLEKSHSLLSQLCCLSFIYGNTEKLLKDVKDNCPRWFAIVVPAMLELAESNALQVDFPESVRETVSYIFTSRQNFLNKEKLEGEHYYPPLLSYLEALPPSYGVREEDILSNLSSDGSLFQSPSATAKAFMLTTNKKCLNYLQFLAQRCPNGVPQTYPMDEDLIKLCMVNQLEKLGLAEHFTEDIEETLAQIYWNYKDQKAWVKPSNMIATQLHKDSLAFQLFRMHGYKVSPSRFCWFLRDENIRGDMEKHPEYFASSMLNVYRASNLMFSGEFQVEEANSFSRKLLHKILSQPNRDHHQSSSLKVKLPMSHKMIEHELNVPWLARLEHLEHRMWIEEKEANSLWVGKASYNRISNRHNDELLQLAIANYECRQSLYKYELKELKRWSEELGLTRMGFGREKTSYCYFAVAAATSLPRDSYIRMLVAKSAIVITVADDFFDMKASLPQLQNLTHAIQRWDSKGLSGHSKVIFDALDNVVSEAAARYLLRQGIDITNTLRDLWYETFGVWLIEAKWSRNGESPSNIDEYLKTAIISVGSHTMLLPASCFLNPSLPIHQLRPPQYQTITKLLMLICRLLNDLQSYQREKEDGKMNSVLINMMENPELEMEDSVSFLREIIERRKKEFLEQVLVEGMCDWARPIKQFHLACLRVFEMFFNSSNHFDSNTYLLEDIHKAIYSPIKLTTNNLNIDKKTPQIQLVPAVNKNNKYEIINSSSVKLNRCYKHKNRINVIHSTSTGVAARLVFPHNALRNGGYGMTPKVGVVGFF